MNAAIAMFVGTTVLTIIGAVTARTLARSSGRRDGRDGLGPSPVGIILAALFLSLGLVIGGGNHGGIGAIPMPSAALCVLIAISKPDGMSMLTIILLLAQMMLIGSIFAHANE